MTILGCLVDCVVPCLTFVGRLVLGSGTAGGRLCKGETTDFQEFKISSATWVRGRGLHAMRETIDFKKIKFASAMGCEGCFMQGEKRSIFKKKKKLGFGGA